MNRYIGGNRHVSDIDASVAASMVATSIGQPVHVARAYPPRPTCDTCQHWDTPINGTGKLGHCLKITSNMPDDYPLDVAFATALYTGPKFGCIHHQQKAKA